MPGDSVEQQVAAHMSASPPRPSAVGVPAGFDHIIAKGMAKTVHARYQSTIELARAARVTADAPPIPQHRRVFAPPTENYQRPRTNAYPNTPPPSPRTYQPVPIPPAPNKPGSIPIRPLKIWELFLGSFASLAASPWTIFGLVIALFVSMVGALLAGATGLVYTCIQWFSAGIVNAAVTMVAGRAILGRSLRVGELGRQMLHRGPALVTLAVIQVVPIVVVSFTLHVLEVDSKDETSSTAAVFAGAFILAAIAFSMVFAQTVLVLEKIGPFRAITRSAKLAFRGFFRVFAVYFTITLSALLLYAALIIPMSTIVASMKVESTSHAATLASDVLAAVGWALWAPVLASALTLTYADQRFRREGFADVVHRSLTSHHATFTNDEVWSIHPRHL